MSARESGALQGMKVEQCRALVITQSPQTVLASTGNLIFLTAVKSESVAMVVVAYHLENYSESHIRSVVSTSSLPIHNPMRLEIKYNSLADSAAFGSILWTWMMSTCLVIACLTFGYVPRPRSTLACVYRFEGASIFVSYSSFPHSHGCLGDRRLLASYLSQLRLIR